MGLAGVCLALAAATSGGTGPAPVFVPVQRFTLAWTHSIEKTRWEEDYAVVAPIALPDDAVESTTAPILRATGARVRGSGAGMEPPDDAVLRNGWYEYTPATPPLRVLRLTRSPYTADYDWCVAGQCQSLSRLLATDGGVTLLWPCSEPGGGSGQARNGALKPGG